MISDVKWKLHDYFFEDRLIVHFWHFIVLYSMDPFASENSDFRAKKKMLVAAWE